MDGFSAYAASPQRDGKRVVLLNVYATLLASIEEGLSFKETILTNLMHEFGHAMQQYLDMEFAEEQVERNIQTYIDVYGEEGNVSD